MPISLPPPPTPWIRVRGTAPALLGELVVLRLGSDRVRVRAEAGHAARLYHDAHRGARGQAADGALGAVAAGAVSAGRGSLLAAVDRVRDLVVDHRRVGLLLAPVQLVVEADRAGLGSAPGGDHVTLTAPVSESPESTAVTVAATGWVGTTLGVVITVSVAFCARLEKFMLRDE